MRFIEISLFQFKGAFLLFLILFFYSCTSSQVREDGQESVAMLLGDTVTKPVDNPVMYPTAYLLGKFNPSADTTFVEIPSAYANKAGMYMNRLAFEAFKKMYEAARKEGLNLKIISATRNFDYQKGIWERKWTGKTLVGGKNISSMPADERALMILRYSSMPGTSRHHWGTDIDLNDLNNSYFEKGEGFKIYQWMLKNAATYGFCQPYSAKGEARPHGYEEEKWHWSYMPISRELTDAYKKQVSSDMITGFKGAETAQDIEVIKKYVLGISADCLISD